MDNAGRSGSPTSSPSPHKQRTPRPSNCFSHCFGGGDAVALDPVAGENFPPTSPVRSPPSWPLSSKVHDHPELKGKHQYRSLIHRRGKHRRPAAGVFGYDPLSYSLNFDEGPDFDGDRETPRVEFRDRSFSSRLPSSPPQPATPVATINDGIARNYSPWV